MIKNSWREVQKTFFSNKDTVEFEQDLRIFNFFADSKIKQFTDMVTLTIFLKK